MSRGGATAQVLIVSALAFVPAYVSLKPAFKQQALEREAAKKARANEEAAAATAAAAVSAAAREQQEHELPSFASTIGDSVTSNGMWQKAMEEYNRLPSVRAYLGWPSSNDSRASMTTLEPENSSIKSRTEEDQKPRSTKE